MKTFLRLVAVLVLVLVAIAGLAWFMFDGEQVRPQLETQLTDLLGRPVQIGSLELAVIGGQLVAEKISIADDPAFSDQPFIQASQLDLTVAWLPLFTDQTLRIKSLQLVEPTVSLRQNAQGQWNFASLGAQSPPAQAQPADASTESSAALSVDQLRVEAGTLLLILSDGRERRYEALAFSADQLGADNAFPFELTAKTPGAGSLSINGNFGPWHPGAATETPLLAEIRLERLDLAGSGIVGAEASVAGLVDFDGSLKSANESLAMEGVVHARDLQLIEGEPALEVPLVIDYAATYDLRRSRGELSRGTLGTGSSGLDLSGDFVQTPQGLSLDMRANAQELPVDDIQSMLPAFGIRLPEDARLVGGTLTANMVIRGTLDRLEVAGPVELSDTEMVGFSLGDKLSVALSLAGMRVPSETRLAKANLILRSNPSGMRVGDLTAQIVELGRISGDGRVSSEDALDFDLQLLLDKGLADSAGALGSTGARVLGFAATSGVGLKVSGNLADPQIKADQSTVANALVSGLLGSRRDQNAGDEQADEKDVVGSLLEGLTRRKKDD